mmetsp:Transcript_17827/g.31215  ORF Transcript_17827/g.31215 Transcript_17827/m.31215 type:complete len:294 (+) Transcript_17827:622-1503(+)
MMPVSVEATLIEACTVICCPAASVTAGGRSTSFRSPCVESSTRTFCSVSLVRFTTSSSKTRSKEWTWRKASTYTGSARPVICCTFAKRSEKSAPSAAACPAMEVPRAALKSSSSSMAPPEPPPPLRSRSCRNTMHSSGATDFSTTSSSWPMAHSEFCVASSSTLASCERPVPLDHSACRSCLAAFWLSESCAPLPTNERMHWVRRTALSLFSPPQLCCFTSLNRFTTSSRISFFLAVDRFLHFMLSFVSDTPSIADSKKSPPIRRVRKALFLTSGLSSSCCSSSPPSYTFCVP